MNNQEVEWLLLLYSLPAEPSAPRVQVWRRLNELGALRLPSGGYLLPEHAGNRAALDALGAEISAHEGSATLFRAVPLTTALETELRERYNAARSAEYAELERECGRLRDHIQREIEHFVFTFEEIEELEAELTKIRQRLEAVDLRDVFAVPARASVEAILTTCEALLASFTEQVFQREASEEAVE